MAEPSSSADRRDRAVVLLAALVLAVLALPRAAGGGTPPPKPVLPRPLAVSLSGSGGCPALPAARVVLNAPGAGRTVALTFDDGPGADTVRVLDVLRRNQVRASFFLTGEAAAADPGTVRAVADGGHLVGLHVWTLDTAPVDRPWSRSSLDEQLSRTERVLRGNVPNVGCWYRPAARSRDGLHPTVERHGLTVALWTVPAGDWTLQEGRTSAPPALVDTIVERATAVGDQIHPVVLLHDGGGYRGGTVAALPRIIEFYRSRGFRFVRLDATG